MPKRNGRALWEDGLKECTGTVSMGSGMLDAQPCGFNTRFEETPGTNPEELVAAAPAACFSMAASR
ncbi:osmotically inducible protein OsmC [Jannaschia seohaensis]|uniref:Osmotically inducible protein OsmC n=1 Tax=Jannaschia seohaensis TaxID=475081 RepID=A0A2Y9AQK6_9RHOB|nr:osmotically inducible protein OsmC [Jannaschia seohaensis]SSA46664.1 osmotically inducible protein OsmC [Jannaschia seohaensis]